MLNILCCIVNGSLKMYHKQDKKLINCYLIGIHKTFIKDNPLLNLLNLLMESFILNIKTFRLIQMNNKIRTNKKIKTNKNK